MKLISRLSIIPSSRDRFRGLVTNTTIWLLSCSALDGLIGARLRSTHPGLLRRGAETPTDDQEITEAGQFIFLFNISKKEKFIYIYNKRFVSNQKILLIDTITFFFFFFFHRDLEITAISTFVLISCSFPWSATGYSSFRMT